MAVRACRNAPTSKIMKHASELAVGVLVLVNLMGIAAAFSYRNREEKRKHRQQETIQLQKEEMERYRDVLTSQFQSDHFRLDGNLPLRGETGEKLLLSGLPLAYPKLILYLDENHCDSCVDLLIFSIKKTLPEIGYANFLILYAARDYPSKWMKIKTILPEAAVYRLDDQSLVIPAVELKVPVLFVCDSSLYAESPIPALPGMQELISSYLKTIQSRYFSKNPIL